MATKTKSAPKKKAAKASDTPATPRAGRRSASFDFSGLVREVRDLRSVREKYQQLLHEHNGLLGTLKDLSSELGTSARRAWDNYRGGKAPAGGGVSTRRARTASAHVDGQYEKLCSVIPTAWTSKEDICKAAGLDPQDANTAFRRLVTGFKRGGKSHPAKLESNGKRGTEGRYRKK